MSKRILLINLCNYGSTGKIIEDLSILSEKEGIEVLKCYPKSKIGNPEKPNDYVISGEYIHKINRRLAVITGLAGCFAWISTIRLINRIKKFSPDIIHLHNLHSDYINLCILFSFLKKYKKPVLWTLHDCWSFTGRCPFFQVSKCEKWKDGCIKCVFPKKSYPQTYVDTSWLLWRWKKKWFCGLQNLEIITPSKWMNRLVKDSYLGEYNTKVVYNGIDLNVFKPRYSDIKKSILGVGEKYLILGVAMSWNIYKGIDVFIKMQELIGEEYHILLIGATEKDYTSKKITVWDTLRNQEELAKAYTAADVFFNPTREEVLGLTNLEALACGTPVVTFRTGGSPECIDETCGFVVDDGNMDEIVNSIKDASTKISSEDCIKRAKKFDKKIVYKDYIDSYRQNTLATEL